VAQRLSGGEIRIDSLADVVYVSGAVDKSARLQSRKSLHRTDLSDILEAVPGAERMSQWRTGPPKRLHDSQTPVVGTRISLENRRVGRWRRNGAGTELSGLGHRGPQG
jgi:hypothetical protein